MLLFVALGIGCVADLGSSALAGDADPNGFRQTQAISAATTPNSPGPFRVKVDPYITVRAGAATSVPIRLKVPQKTKLYKDQISVEMVNARGLVAGAAVLPKATPWEDPFGGGLRDVYSSDMEISLPITAPADKRGRVDLTVTVYWQGCSDNTCYMPGSQTFNLPVHVMKGK